MAETDRTSVSAAANSDKSTFETKQVTGVSLRLSRLLNARSRPLYLVGVLAENRSVVVHVKHLNFDLSAGLVEGVRCQNSQRVLRLLLVVQGLGQRNHPGVLVDGEWGTGAAFGGEAIGDGRAQIHVVSSHLGDRVTRRSVYSWTEHIR